MSDIAVSIIIPVYNTEKYLEKCLDSCVKQTLENIEVICIDDASTDNSENIISHYVEKYPQKVRYARLKENMKQGAARNYGINIAAGEYLCFVDSDDYIEPDLCEDVYLAAKQDQADICYYDYYYHKEGILHVEKVNEAFCNSKNLEMYAPWNQLIKRLLIVENKLYFPERTYLEDAFIVPLWRCFAQRETKIKSGKAYYHYVIRNDSTMAGIKDMMELLDAVQYRYERAVKYDLMKNYKTYLSACIYEDICRVLEHNMCLHDGFTQNTVDKIKNKLQFWKNHSLDTSKAYYYLSSGQIKLVQHALSDPESLSQYYQSKQLYEKFIVAEGYHGYEAELKGFLEKVGQMYGRRIGFWGTGKKGLPLLKTLIDLEPDLRIFDSMHTGEKLFEDKPCRIHKIEEVEGNIDVVLVTSILYYKEISKRLESLYPDISVINVWFALRYGI